jgi:hypothetical protein
MRMEFYLIPKLPSKTTKPQASPLYDLSTLKWQNTLKGPRIEWSAFKRCIQGTIQHPYPSINLQNVF